MAMPERRNNQEHQVERLRELASSAAALAVRVREQGEYADKLLDNGLYLTRLRLFPEAGEPSPYGRLVTDGNRARIVKPRGA